MSSDDNCVVFRHSQDSPDEEWNPNYRRPKPEVVHEGTEEDCQAYVRRATENHDQDNPDLFGASRPRLEVRRVKPRYEDTEPL